MKRLAVSSITKTMSAFSPSLSLDTGTTILTLNISLLILNLCEYKEVLVECQLIRPN